MNSFPDLDRISQRCYPGDMDGMAERLQGYSRRLVNALRVGQTCTLSDIAGLLDRQTNALAGRGVYRNTGADCFVIFVTLDKKPDATQYRDHGRVAQRESIAFTRRGSAVRSCSRP